MSYITDTELERCGALEWREELSISKIQFRLSQLLSRPIERSEAIQAAKRIITLQTAGAAAAAFKRGEFGHRG